MNYKQLYAALWVFDKRIGIEKKIETNNNKVKSESHGANTRETTNHLEYQNDTKNVD